MDFMLILEVLKHGLLDFTWIQILIYLLVVTQITILSVTIYLHRTMAHSALILHPYVAHFFRFWIWLTAGIITTQ